MNPTPLTDLRAFLDVLRREGELRVIDAEVDPDLEAAEVHRRVIAAGGPALLFANVKGSPWPAVTNLFGTARRVELAFGKDPQRLVQRLADAPHTMLPPSLGKLWQNRDLIGSLLKVGRKHVRNANLTQCVDAPPQLSRLPLLRTWEEDGGAFVTLPLVYTEHPGGLGSNLGMYRSQRFDDGHMGLHVQIGKGGGFHLGWRQACCVGADHRQLGQACLQHAHQALVVSATPANHQTAAVWRMLGHGLRNSFSGECAQTCLHIIGRQRRPSCQVLVQPRGVKEVATWDATGSQRGRKQVATRWA